MSRIAGAALLLIILVDSFYESTALPSQFHVSKKDIRKCRCTVSPKGHRKCPVPLFPMNDKEKTNLFQCLCSKKHQFPEFLKPCTSWLLGFPISLV